jgi:hypothetical protein
MERPGHFRDVMLRGPFRRMSHDHNFQELAPGLSEMKDIFTFQAPFGILGRFVEIVVLRDYMRSLLEERNAVIRKLAESEEWRRFLPVSAARQ